MYTIFKNDTSIILTDDRNILSLNNCFLWSDFNQKDELNALLSKSKATYYMYADDLDLMWTDFKNMYRIIEAGGGIVSNDKDDILFIFRHGKWDLPKGKIEEDETREAASVREVEEECGLQNVELLSYFNTSYHIYEEGDEEILKVSYWYRMYSEELDLIPQIEEGITDLAWVDKKDIPEILRNSYSNIVMLLEMYTSGEQQ